MKENETYQHIHDEKDFIWHLLDLYLIKQSGDESKKWVASMYERDFELRDIFEHLLLAYWEDDDFDSIIAIAKEGIRQFLFKINRHVLLIAILVEKECLTINEASSFLPIRYVTDYENYSKELQNVIDIAWLTNEDEKDGIMSPDNDDLLSDSLIKFKKYLLYNLDYA